VDPSEPISRRRVLGAGVAIAAAATASGLPLGCSSDTSRAAHAGAMSDDTIKAPLARHVSGDAFALKGCVVAEHTVLDPGYVTIDPSGQIAAVSASAPTSTYVLDTDGVVLPGLIDLHNHPEWNIFPPWEPPQRYGNRYEWRASPVYEQLVAEPEAKLAESLPLQTQLRYAEVRSLVGGVTAIQGASSPDAATLTSTIRTVDQEVFGTRIGRSMVDLPLGEGDPLMATLRANLADIEAGRVKAFYVHLAEGARDDPETLAEFAHLEKLHGLTPATVVIHGAGLTRSQLGDLRDVGAKLVWSPQSNLRLYGETTRAADALDVGVTLGIGPDWLPSGSASLLAELRTARQVLADQGHPVTAAFLVRAVTSTAATIAGLDQHIGTLAARRPADVTVLSRLHADPFESVLLSDRNDVDAVFVQGALAYGRADWAGQLGVGGDGRARQLAYAWGRLMVLDTGTEPAPGGGTRPAATLDELRRRLLAAHPQVGPIFA